MDKGTPSGLFVNDGSFMERFKQLQRVKEKDGAKNPIDASPSTRPAAVVSATSKSILAADRSHIDAKMIYPCNSAHGSSGGKLAFSLKQKSKLLTPVKLTTDDDEEETAVRNDSGDSSLKRQKLSPAEVSRRALKQSYIAPPFPTDPTVKKVADRLANFVAKHGRQLEHVTRQKNPGDTPFKFLFDETCADYKYYEFRLNEEEKVLHQRRETQVSRTGTVNTSTLIAKSPSAADGSTWQNSNYSTPASALYEDNKSKSGESNASVSADPIAMMEFYMKKAAQEESRRKPKMSKNEMPPPPSIQGPSVRGHHMGDYIPPDELEKFFSSCNDAAAQRAAREAAEKAKIQADNVGHKLLSKMGWKEGEGLGSSKSGIADPIMAGDVKINNLGVGAHQPGEVMAEDDIYEQYKKRMMLGYRHRPNPLNNPRKAYY